MVRNLIALLEPRLPHHPQGLPAHLQVLSTLHFLAKGPYQKTLGQEVNIPMSQSGVSRNLHNVIPAINELVDDFISFPSTPEERQRTAQRY